MDDERIVELLRQRFAARALQNYPTADLLRDELGSKYGIDLNDRANTWKDANGRVGTQDGPDYFENRGVRLQEARTQRKKLKEQAKAERLAAERKANSFAQHDGREDANAPRDANAFVAWLRAEDGPLKNTKPYAMYPELAESCIEIVEKWRVRFEKHVWLRVLGGGSRGGVQQRLVKELLESLHVMARVVQHLDRDVRLEDSPVTVLDLCSGFGYLSMFLAELLPAARVDKIVLLDKAWPMHSQEKASTGQINPEHIFHADWPIRMTTSKNNLKTPAGRRSVEKHIFENAPGAVIVLGIHLCGQLSVRAVELFNTNPKCSMLALKPCCLPQVWAGMPNTVWNFSNGQTLQLEQVGINGRFIKNIWRGPPRSTLVRKFACWGNGLYSGIACRCRDSV
eukprot:CAMPEP_0179408082 /NCGR_PEP_ID=MMETSP0799-20121207/1885_1 /TAXON_ID=46947 /ORGANISM="Geminigera cryophila, Strain CCMP2564" /LENGTH=396 /DNA_ID=CAMNT_0021179483 /DNA_START=58 /DNA_END=1245 /DNA_ORIENTATION=-